MINIKKIFANIKKRWNAFAGYYEFLRIAIPLIISTGAWAFQSFVNRFFLAWYSNNAYAASLPAGLLECSIMDIFIGTIAYINVFVAQYNGKKKYKAIGPSLWQTVHIAFLSSIIMLAVAFFSDKIFNFIGHPQDIIVEEIKYFKILCYGAFPYLASTALSGFYAGRGKTKTILVINIVGIIVNIIFDYLLIFGYFGFHELGIVGAAIATIIGATVVLILFLSSITSKNNNKTYNTRKIKPDLKFIKYFLKYAFPNGMSWFLDMSVFTFFVLTIGTLGKIELSATNVAFNIYSFAYMAIVGCAMTTSILVGNYIGKNKFYIAQTVVKTALHITYTYISLMVVSFLFIPNILIYPFSKGSESLIIEQIRPIAITLLRYTAIFAFFESSGIIFSSAIKGGGDTKFAMKLLIALFIITALTIYLAVFIFKVGLYQCWSILIAYDIILMISFYLRYKTNKWKHMCIIEIKIVDNK
ncbi:MAG: MATE family efflux transporter [Endomicrobium sp.]|jgi:MATE family multidrug resistance protein|nr:MATE family efflux transporter [Endomicrobium sp.]